MTTDSGKRIALAQVIVLILVTFAVYGNTLSNGFVYDDDAQIVENNWIKSARYIPRILFTDVWKFYGESTSSYYRPLMHLVYMANYKIFGLSALGFHLVNLLFHAGVSVFVLLLTRGMLRIAHPAESARILHLPFMASLLFAVHPIHTEVVAWVGGIPELSFTLFALVSFFFHIRSGQTEGRLSRNASYLLSIGSFALAMFSKETAVVLPVLLVAHDYVFKDGSTRLVASLRRCRPYLAVIGIYLVMRLLALGGFAPLRRHGELSTFQYVINALSLFAQYLYKLIFPVDLNVFYVFHPISSIMEARSIVSIISTCAFIALLMIFFKRDKLVFYCLVMIGIPLIPVLYIPGLGENTFAERYLYFPSIGYAILLSLFLVWIGPKRQMVLPVVFLLAIAAIFSAGTFYRNRVWKDNFTLWSDTIKKSSDGAIPNAMMGDALLSRGMVDAAIRYHETALSLRPDYYGSIVNLGVAYLGNGWTERAIEQYRRAMKIRPDHYGAHINLGLAYMKKGRIDEAVDQFEIAIRLNPESAGAFNNLGLAYDSKGMLGDAIKQYDTAVYLNPDYADAYNNLGIAFARIGDIDKAIRNFEIAVRLNSEDDDFRRNLIRAKNMKK